MDREYIYHEATSCLCPLCLKLIPAKVIFMNQQVFLLKYCPEHGEQLELWEEDLEYHLKKRNFDKPGTISTTQTEIKSGCPFDCGLCPNHDQHTCIALIEVTSACNLNCPICYAGSGQKDFLSPDKVSEMLDFFVASEGGEAEILQISGGEPTIHPQIIDIIKIAQSKKIKYIMLNTNGLRIAQDEGFARELSQFKGKFEIYLQFDGFRDEVYQYFRGRDLGKIKQKALENLMKYQIPVTLVTTVETGVNDGQLGEIIDFGINTVGIRGVNFQPVAYFGRRKKNQTGNRVTLSGIIKRIESQASNVFMKGDIIPLPCNVERVAVTYLAKGNVGKFIPITRNVKVNNYLSVIDNTFLFDADTIIKKKGSPEIGCCACLNFVKDLRNIIPLNFPLKSTKEKTKYINENTFRISVTSFLDPYNFDIKSMQKECVHVITPDLKKIPFSAYNIFYRK